MGIGLGIVRVEEPAPRRPGPAPRTSVTDRSVPGPRSVRSHEHDWRAVAVSHDDVADVTESLCATCSAVSFTGTLRTRVTASAESRAFIRVRFPHTS